MTTTKLPTSMREACEMLYAQLTPEDIQQIRTRKVDALEALVKFIKKVR